MQLKKDNEWFTLTTNEIKYTRNIHSKLYSIVQTIEDTETYQEILVRLDNLTSLDDEMLIIFSKL